MIPGQSPATPYVLAALTLGYLACYVGLLTRRAWVGALPLLVVVLAAGYRNAPDCTTGGTAALRRCSEAVVASMGDRHWLITSGRLDNHLLLAAHDRGQNIRILNVVAARNPAMLRQYAEQLPEEVRPLAMIGADAMLREWLQPERGAYRNVAVFGVPYFLQSMQLAATPHHTVLFAAHRPEPVNKDTARALDAFWQDHRSALLPPANDTDDAAPTHTDTLCRFVLRQGSMIANNTAVSLEDANQADAAFRAYQLARTIDDSNISALLNQVVMLDNGYASADAADIRSRVKTLESEIKKGSIQVWRLSAHYGYVRHPESFRQMGWFWAMSGQPELAEASIRRAVTMSSDKQRHLYRAQLAYFCAAHNKGKESAKIFQDMVKKNPADYRALLSLARLSLQDGDMQTAKQYADQAGKVQGVPHQLIAFEHALQASVLKQNDAARIILEELVAATPTYTPAWTLLGDLAILQNDGSSIRRCVEHLKTVPGAAFYVHTFEGRWAYREKKFIEAKRHLEAALLLKPGNLGVLQTLMQLTVLLEHRDAAKRYAQLFLKQRPTSSLASYVLGSIAAYEGHSSTAETMYRRSLRTQRSPAILNDLAWLLQSRGNMEEAEQLAREAASIAPRNGPILDTLGIILLRAGKKQEAIQVMGKAIALQPGHAGVMLHMAELQIATGNKAEARDTLKAIVPKAYQLSVDEREELRRLQRDAGR